MKKWLIALLVLFAIAISCIYIFIPAHPYISAITPVHCTVNGAYRILADSSWKKWWPGFKTAPEIYEHRGYHFQITKVTVNGITVSVTGNDISTNCNVLILPVRVDSVNLVWQASLPGSNNPLKRVQQYYRSVDVENAIDAVSNSLKNYLQNTAHVYGFAIEHTVVDNFNYIATRQHLVAYPTTSQIYFLVNELNKYSAEQNAAITGSPIYHVTQIGTSNYECMVALPVNKELPGNNQLFYRKMVPGKLLTTEVKGTAAIAEAAIEQMRLYVEDHHQQSPAVPYQSLITNRSVAKDSTQWITRIYYPVF